MLQKGGQKSLICVKWFMDDIILNGIGPVDRAHELFLCGIFSISCIFNYDLLYMITIYN